jgi:hypothetical protein
MFVSVGSASNASESTATFDLASPSQMDRSFALSGQGAHPCDVGLRSLRYKTKANGRNRLAHACYINRRKIVAEPVALIGGDFDLCRASSPMRVSLRPLDPDCLPGLSPGFALGLFYFIHSPAKARPSTQ